MLNPEILRNNLEVYNNSIFPMQIIMPVVAIILTYFLFTKPYPKVDKKIFILLLIPAVGYGFVVPITVGVWAAILLLIPGIYGSIILIKNWKVIGK